MKIEKNRVVSLSYNLHVPESEGNGEELVEQTSPENPFVFLLGGGNLLEAFENNLIGKTTGEGFDFIIPAANAYGEYDADKLAEIPIEAFQGPDGSIDEEMVQPGNELPMVDNDGNRLLGIVDEVTPEFVRMDFNHPLSGNDLHFTGIILNVREATHDEIAHGHVHGPHGHQH